MIQRRYRGLPTEQPNPACRDLDVLPARDIVRIMNAQDAKVAGAVRAQAPRIARAVETIARALRRGGRLTFIGAGTSGRLGILEAAECPPTFSTPPSLVRGIMAGGRGAVFRSREGAEDDEEDGFAETSRSIRGGDVVVGVAASGITPFVRGAFRAARAKGAKTVLVTSNTRKHGQRVDISIAVGVGPEVLAGSTRLKSATAAKMVLNMLTTGAMIRLGKVYGNRMVDLKPSSHKLRQRSARMLCELAGVAPARAEALLKASSGSVKTAVLMARAGVAAAEARRRLKKAGGFLRLALREKR